MFVIFQNAIFFFFFDTKIGTKRMEETMNFNKINFERNKMLEMSTT